MSKRHTITVTTLENVNRALNWLDSTICKGLPGGSVSIDVYRYDEIRSPEQNAKMWPMLTDISAQLEWYGEKLSPDDWKDLLGHEWRSQRIVPGISGGYVALGAVRTSKMKKRDFCDLIEIIYAFGAQKGVRWSEKSLECYQEYMQAQ